MNNLFRKAALHKLHSPDKLDQMIRIINIRSWLYFLFLFISIIFIIIFSIKFNLKTIIEVNGVLLSKERTFEIKSENKGRIISIKVKEGDQVKKGDTILIIDIPDINDAIIKETDRINILKDKYNNLSNHYNKKLKNKRNLYKRNNVINNLKLKKIQLIHKDDKKFELEKNIYKEIIKKRMFNSKIALKNLNYIFKNRLIIIKQKIDKKYNYLNELKDKLKLESHIKSKDTGIVKEIYVSEGDIIYPENEILDLMLGDLKEEVIIFVSKEQINKLKENDSIKIVFSGLKNLEIYGNVKRIYKYPVNSEYIKNNFIENYSILKESCFGVLIDSQLERNALKKIIPSNYLFNCFIELDNKNFSILAK